MSKALTQRTEFYNVWQKFITTGADQGIPEDIEKSWKRCREIGFDPQKEITPIQTELKRIQKRIDEHIDLHQLLQSHQKNIEKYFDFIPIIILFSDRDGYLLSTSGHDKILRWLAERTLEIGGNIKETVIGTNAPGICLAEGRPATVMAEEHYSQIFHWCSCIATPIFDQRHNLLGSLNFSSTVRYREKLKRLMPLLLNTANSIQFELSLKQKLQQLELFNSYFHSTFEYSGSILILVNRQGRVIDLNRKAQELFRIDPDEIRNRDVRRVLKNESKISHLFKGSSIEKISSLGSISPEGYSVESIPIFNKLGIETAYLLKLEKEKTGVAVAGKAFSTARYDFKNIIGQSEQILGVIDKAKKAARTSSNVLIEGETGTGKELFAHAIHNESEYCYGPFVAVNCCAIPHELIESELFGYEKGAYTDAKKEGNIGKFELANGGTVFLDEIHGMDLSAQMKILRVIEDRQVTRIGGKYPIPLNIRILVASTKSLEDEVEQGNFIPALFFRLNVVRLHIPSLREREEDVSLLVKYFIKEMNEKFNRSIRGVEPEALKVLSQYSWPGNIRELKNCIESAFNLCSGEIITSKDLNLSSGVATKSRRVAEKGQTIESITKNLMIESLNRYGNVKQAAKFLGISASTFYRKMKKFKICIHKNMHP